MSEHDPVNVRVLMQPDLISEKVTAPLGRRVTSLVVAGLEDPEGGFMIGRDFELGKTRYSHTLSMPPRVAANFKTFFQAHLGPQRDNGREWLCHNFVGDLVEAPSLVDDWQPARTTFEAEPVSASVAAENNTASGLILPYGSIAHSQYGINIEDMVASVTGYRHPIRFMKATDLQDIYGGDFYRYRPELLGTNQE